MKSLAQQGAPTAPGGSASGPWALPLHEDRALAHVSLAGWLAIVAVSVLLWAVLLLIH